MASKNLLTIFGATGNQGGSVLDIILSRPELNSKYALRGITRDPSSAKSQALAAKGVEMVKAELNDVESLKAAVKGSYGVFAMTDFWAVMSKDIEVQQGMNLFEAVKSQGVKHYVWSTLPHVEKMTNGVLKHVDHFDGKANVAEHVEANKGDMIVSYFMPSMFMDIRYLVKSLNGTPSINVPFPSENIAWPLFDPRSDSGKYVMGLFEGGASANGVKVNAVSDWTTPKKVVAALSKESGKEVVFNAIPKEVFASFLPDNVKNELTETMLLVGDYSYYGKGTEKKQAESAKWLIKDSELMTFEAWAKKNAPFDF
ncbi:Hypothetical protein R9X50_00419600 [Acrodontium crateriforme]|uniref:NmrA-like domain-containing protein n=1 Tax=Acrodontium crateriforme TaxID=150365 RepID=A0AAQ3M4B2_9PEZI|nr:Hypothetical protein R9X50_00419600 [Acrodontium crateriforme]